MERIRQATRTGRPAAEGAKRDRRVFFGHTLRCGRRAATAAEACGNNRQASQSFAVIERELDLTELQIDHGLDDDRRVGPANRDRKSKRLNSSHLGISYAVFCLKKKRMPTSRALPL